MPLRSPPPVPLRLLRAAGPAGAVLLLATAALADPAPAPPAGEPIEVTIEGSAARSRSGSRDPTAASYVLRGEALRAPGRSAADALAEVPGVQLQRTGSGSDLATASIRGATSAQTPVYLAGIRINDDVTGTADLSTVPLWMVDRIEVYRGNAPEAADRLGIGGAVFIDPVLPKGSRAGMGLGAGSYREVTAWQAGAVGDARSSAMVAFQRQSAANDYPFTDNATPYDPRGAVSGRRLDADHATYDVWTIGRTTVGRARFTTIASAFARDQGIPGPPLAPSLHARAHVQRLLAGVTAKLPCGALDDDRCAVELTTSALVAGYGLRDPRRQLGLGATWVDSAGARISEEARLRYRLDDAVRLSASASQQLERLAIDRSDPGPVLQGGAAGPVRARRSTTRATAAIGVEPTPALELDALGAVECHGTSGPAGSDTCGVLAPLGRLGARLRLAEGVALLANAGRYVRVPTLGEKYGTSPIFPGNPALGPEEGVTVDLGARLSATSPGPAHLVAYAEVFGFARWAQSLIAYEEASLGVVRPYNLGSARVLGAELAAGATAYRLLRAELSLTALDPRDTADDTFTGHLLPLQARLVAVPSVELYRDEPLGPRALDRIALGARYVYRASRYADQASTVRLPAQSTLSVHAAALFARRSVAARLEVANVLDARDVDVLGLPLPGRTVHGSLEAWW